MTLPVDELVTVAKFGEPIYPYLEKLDQVEHAPGDPLWHIVMEAENFHALQLLAYLYPHKCDCLYLDPPYNTGAKDWKYNNNYVDGNDQYRHSKWLSFMKHRLELAKRLLNPRDSVLIVTIDEKEYLHLGMLLEDMFPDATVQMISSVINPKAIINSSARFPRSSIANSDATLRIPVKSQTKRAALGRSGRWKDSSKNTSLKSKRRASS